MSRINIQSSRGTIDLRPVMGRMGPQGIQGIQGIQGNDGAPGGEGATGPQGLPGVNAVANDTATAGYISTAGTSLTKTALEAGYATRSLGLAPGPMTGVKVAVTGTTPVALEVFDGYTWGYYSGNIYRSSDDGETWAVYCPSPAGDRPRRIIPTSDGEVVVALASTVRKSSGWAGGSPTWTTKVTVTGTATFQPFSVDGDGTKFIVSQYGDYVSSRYAHISTDSGATWTQVWDSVAKFGATDADVSHIHGVCYDKWSDRFYLAEGHAPNDKAGIYVSTDNGATWTKPTGLQASLPPPTVIVATDDGLVCGADSAMAGVWGVVRQADPADEVIARTFAWRPGPGVIGFGVRGFREPRTGAVYIGFRSSHPDVAPIITGGTAAAASLVYRWPTTPVVALDDIQEVIVPRFGKLLANAKVNGATYNIKARVPGPTIGARPDEGGVLGGFAPAADSVAAGFGSKAGPAASIGVTGLRNTALGVKASAHATEDGTAIGYNSSAPTAGSTAVGSGANAASGSTVVGKSAVGSSQSTAVGLSASTADGTQGTAIGESSYARVQSVSVGYTAKSSPAAVQSVALGAFSLAGSQGIAIGYNASTSTNGTSIAIGYNTTITGGGAAVTLGSSSTAFSTGVALGASANAGFARSVALGQNTVTTHNDQVAIRDRHIELQELSGAPSNPATDKARLFLVDNGAGKTQLAVKFATGVSIILATEA